MGLHAVDERHPQHASLGTHVVHKGYKGECITVVNAIAFFPWADSDAAIRATGLQQAEREMQMLAEPGCPAVAAPPYGNVESTTLEAMAD